MPEELLQKYNRWKDYNRCHIVMYILCFLSSCGAALSFYFMTERVMGDQCIIGATFNPMATVTVPPPVGGVDVVPIQWIDVPDPPYGCRFFLGTFMFSAATAFILTWFQATFAPPVESFIRGRSRVQAMIPANLIFCVVNLVFVISASSTVQVAFNHWCDWMSDGGLAGCTAKRWKIKFEGDKVIDVNITRIIATTVCAWLSAAFWFAHTLLLIASVFLLRVSRSRKTADAGPASRKSSRFDDTLP